MDLHLILNPIGAQPAQTAPVIVATPAQPVSTTTAPDLSQVFVCEFAGAGNCNTEQEFTEWFRSVVSDFFGRNKLQTMCIPNVIWCRMHYQRASSRRPKNQRIAWQHQKIAIIREVSDRIDALHPGVSYDVQLVAREKDRLDQWLRFSRGMEADPRIAEARAPKPTGKGRVTFKAPFEVLAKLDPYMGKNKSRAECEVILAFIAQMVDNEETEQVPVVEFLKRCGNPGKAVTCSKCILAAGAGSKLYDASTFLSAAAHLSPTLTLQAAQQADA
ncbi:hypothetical protein H2201_002217 [Coniosporium apollinis]|uniref:Uncharacterized protein n=1 Tax=Coniosporium apollinis TaxID=61459 RepID=A0ABQ9NZ92_9PEZI|nr:hypothetical protein H2201_002217 [Coniosporium apollinis]